MILFGHKRDVAKLTQNCRFNFNSTNIIPQIRPTIQPLSSGGSKGNARDACPPPPGAQILSISCTFRENMAKSYVGAPPPPPGELALPPRGNPESATVIIYHITENAYIVVKL